MMIHGEFESLRAIHAVSPSLAPYPHRIGTSEHKAPEAAETSFLLAEYREVGEQPPQPLKLDSQSYI
jgi:protein-ribulosamine 3-kinase